MSLKSFLLLMAVLNAWAATHDEMGRCGLTGIYKLRQNVLESPNYPGHYPPDTCWDYVVRSPYRCPTKFHIQFLDFYLESSNNCTNDYLAVGFENNGDDMDLLCGQVIGIKKYHTPDGVLRLRFRSDDSPWTTGKGFKLLVTRLACEREDLTRVSFRDVDDDSEHVDAPSQQLELPHHNRTYIFRNFLRNRDQYQDTQSRNIGTQLRNSWNVPEPQQLGPPPPPFGGYYLPATAPVSHTPTTRRPVIQVQLDQPDGREKPCSKVVPANLPRPPSQLPLYYNPFLSQQPSAVFNNQYINSPWTPEQPALRPTLKAQQVGSKDSINGQLGPAIPEPCCASSFRQQRLYLSSPGFPRTAFTSLLPVAQRDCQFDLEKTTPKICLLRVEFKFFDFGQTFNGNGDSGGNVNIAIGTTRDICTEDYVEIDGERFCGCRTGYIFTAPWGLGKKVIRMRMGYSGIPSNGFILDIAQEECNGQSGQQQLQQQQGQIITGFQTRPGQQQQQQPQTQQHGNRPNVATQFGLQQQQPGYPIQQQTLFGQQQQFYAPQPQQHPSQQLPGYAQQPLLYPAQQLWNIPQVPYIAPPYNQFGVPEFRRAKRLNVEPTAESTSHQPVTVVETNSTRKEYYYFDGERAFDRIETPSQIADRRADQLVEVDNVRDGEIGVNRVNSKFFSSEKNRCRFDMSDVLTLAVDVLWITKPTCYAPQSNWFGFLG